MKNMTKGSILKTKDGTCGWIPASKETEAATVRDTGRNYLLFPEGSLFLCVEARMGDTKEDPVYYMSFLDLRTQHIVAVNLLGDCTYREKWINYHFDKVS